MELLRRAGKLRVERFSVREKLTHLRVVLILKGPLKGVQRK